MVMLLVLSGCDRGSDNAVCATVPALSAEPLVNATNVPVDPVARRKFASECVHRWAYRLSLSNEPAGTVTDAVLGACYEAIAALQRADSVSFYDRYGRANATFEGLSTLKGKYVPGEEQIVEELRAEALFRVVQARVGHCSAG